MPKEFPTTIAQDNDKQLSLWTLALLNYSSIGEIHMYDVCIIGAGIVGCFLAHDLSKKEISVLFAPSKRFWEAFIPHLHLKVLPQLHAGNAGVRIREYGQQEFTEYHLILLDR